MFKLLSIAATELVTKAIRVMMESGCEEVKIYSTKLSIMISQCAQRFDWKDMFLVAVTYLCNSSFDYNWYGITLGLSETLILVCSL